MDRLLLSDCRDSTVRIPEKSFFSLSIYLISPLSLVCFPSSFSFLFTFSFLSLSTAFPYSFHFPFTLFLSFSYLFFFSFLLLASPTHMDQVGETSPHFPPWPLVIIMLFFFIFFIFFFPFITSCNTWLNVSHLFQVHHMALVMCHSLGVSYDIHMIMSCVT